MVLIFSIELDYSTNEVIKWLNFFEVPFMRINKLKDLYKGTNCNLFSINSNSSLSFQYLKDTISCVWFRKSPDNDFPVIDSDIYLNYTTTLSCYHELMVLRNLILEDLKDKYWLNHPNRSSLNKILVLSKAQNLGLLIPPTIVTSNKKELIEFRKSHLEIITKPLYEVLGLEDNDNNKYMTRTSLVEDKYIDNLNESFFPSLFQKNINKDFEIRTVYLEGNFYSMAIFSQANEKTKIDFRYYNTKQPNRVSAFNLPKEIECKLNDLMKDLNLNFGSLDLIVDNKGDYYFLEINPVGQFGMTSTPNNFQIEKEVALILKNKHYEFTNQ